MLSLKQTTELLASPSKLSAKQLTLIKRIHQDNLLRAGRLKNQNVTDQLFSNKSYQDIRRNPARGQKYEPIRRGIEKAATVKMPAVNICPWTGEYKPFTLSQQNKLNKLLRLGWNRAKAILEVRSH